MNIIHDKEKQKFYWESSGKESYLWYRIDDKILNIIRVFVHPDLRNHGLAAKLTKTALDYARENNLKVIPTCSYAGYFISKNKEYEEILI